MNRILDGFRSRLRWKIDSSSLSFDVDLNNICEFITFGETPSLEVFKSQGILVVNGLFSRDKLDHWTSVIDTDLQSSKFKKNLNSKDYWMSSISDIKNLYGMVADPSVLSIVESLIGKERVFVGHDSVTINYSVPGHHDDQNSHRAMFPDGGYSDDFSTIRTLCYLGGRCSAPQRFGFVPGSHLRESYDIDYSFAKKNTVWVEVSHGSMVFFDPRLIHTASPLNHKKRMVVGTYDLENDYTKSIFEYTASNRGQGAQRTDSEFWDYLSEFSLKPNFI